MGFKKRRGGVSAGDDDVPDSEEMAAAEDSDGAGAVDAVDGAAVDAKDSEDDPEKAA